MSSESPHNAQPTPFFDSQALAVDWANRICERLTSISVPELEVEETRTIIITFTRIAAEELSNNREVAVPYSSTPLVLDTEKAHEIIDLFLRGVNHCAKKLRDSGTDWEIRRKHLEELAWKIFNLAKLLLALRYIPNPALPTPIQTDKDLQLMMKQSAETLFKEQVLGIKSASVPWGGN